MPLFKHTKAIQYISSIVALLLRADRLFFVVEAKTYLRVVIWRSYWDAARPIEVADGTLKLTPVARHSVLAYSSKPKNRPH